MNLFTIIDDLRSGEFIQAHGYLSKLFFDKSAIGYCCLGLICERYSQVEDRFMWTKSRGERVLKDQSDEGFIYKNHPPNEPLHALGIPYAPHKIGGDLLIPIHFMNRSRLKECSIRPVPNGNLSRCHNLELLPQVEEWVRISLLNDYGWGFEELADILEAAYGYEAIFIAHKDNNLRWDETVSDPINALATKILMKKAIATEIINDPRRDGFSLLVDYPDRDIVLSESIYDGDDRSVIKALQNYLHVNFGLDVNFGLTPAQKAAPTAA